MLISASITAFWPVFLQLVLCFRLPLVRRLVRSRPLCTMFAALPLPNTPSSLRGWMLSTSTAWNPFGPPGSQTMETWATLRNSRRVRWCSKAISHLNIHDARMHDRDKTLYDHEMFHDVPCLRLSLFLSLPNGRTGPLRVFPFFSRYFYCNFLISFSFTTVA